MLEIYDILEVRNHIDGLKAVVFDMDDTLYGEKEYVRSGYKQVAKVVPQIKDAAYKLWGFFEEKKPAIDELLVTEGLENPELKLACINAYRFQTPEINFYKGVSEMLKELRDAGYLIGVITDGRAEGQRAKIKALGLENLVDHIIVTDELGGIQYRKPNPVAFEIMKEKFGVEYFQMCYVGDNIKKDFIAPQMLGMKSIWFRNKDGLYVE